MKKHMFFIVVAAFATMSSLNVKSQTKACLNPCSQTWVNGEGKIITNVSCPPNNCPGQQQIKVGIGIVTPLNELHIFESGSDVNSQLTLQGATSGMMLMNNTSTWRIMNEANTNNLRFFNNTTGIDGFTLTPFGFMVNNNTSYKKFIFNDVNTPNSLTIAPSLTASTWDYNKSLVLDGTTGKLTKKIDSDADAFTVYNTNSSLSVFKVKGNGKVYATEVNVMLASTPFPDYVFEADYKLMSLNELSQFISNNKHLPGVPSAQEVANNGSSVNVGEMQIILLKKVEELTLYMLELQKENERLKARIGVVENKQ
jgi:hypothetical protein